MCLAEPQSSSQEHIFVKTNLNCVPTVGLSESVTVHLDSKVGAGATDMLQRVSAYATVVDMAILDGYDMIL